MLNYAETPDVPEAPDPWDEQDIERLAIDDRDQRLSQILDLLWTWERRDF